MSCFIEVLKLMLMQTEKKEVASHYLRQNALASKLLVFLFDLLDETLPPLFDLPLSPATPGTTTLTSTSCISFHVCC